MGAAQTKPVPQITINSLDAEVPLIPPVVLLALLAVSGLLARSVDRFRWVEDFLYTSSLKLRVPLFAAIFALFRVFFICCKLLPLFLNRFN